jgi:hypothetical protein
VLWMLLAGRTGTAATVARVAIPVWLVSFAVFDSVTGIASGLAVRHANGLDGPEQQGAGSTADYLVDNRITADFSPVWFVQATALLTAVISTALVLRSAGASRAFFVTMLIGALLVFHAGPAAAVGLVALAGALVLADREGLLLSTRESQPAAAHQRSHAQHAAASRTAAHRCRVLLWMSRCHMGDADGRTNAAEGGSP